MRHFVYNVRYYEVPINSSLLIVTLYSTVTARLVYKDSKFYVTFMTLQPDMPIC
jgi:hypothetical protein